MIKLGLINMGSTSLANICLFSFVGFNGNLSLDIFSHFVHWRYSKWMQLVVNPGSTLEASAGFGCCQSADLGDSLQGSAGILALHAAQSFPRLPPQREVKLIVLSINSWVKQNHPHVLPLREKQLKKGTCEYVVLSLFNEKWLLIRGEARVPKD